MARSGFARTLVAGTLAVALVVTGMPLAAVALGEDADPLNGALDVRIASPRPGEAFSRVEDVVFRDGSQAALCPIVSWTWEFGDQSLGDGPEARHRFTSLGLYEATLLVTGACGRAGHASVVLQIVNLPPVPVLAVPASGVAGSPVRFDGSASHDPDGAVREYRYAVDGVALAAQSSPTLSRTFTVAGPHTVDLRVVDNDGRASPTVSAVVDVRPGPAASLAIAPDVASVPAGGSQGFEARARDAYGNVLAAAPAWRSTCGAIDAGGFFAAPTAAGPCEVRARQDGLEAVEAFAVAPGALAGIVVEGPAQLRVASSAYYAFLGLDRWGNDVPLGSPGTLFHAPRTPGAFAVCHTEGPVSGCRAVEVVAGPLSSIQVLGPDELVAGAVATFGVEGADAWGNPVALAVASFLFEAPTRAGFARACHAEQGVEGCTTVQVLAGPLARIAIEGPDTVRAGEAARYVARGADAHGNHVPLAQSIVDFPATASAGPAAVCHQEQGVQGCKPIEVVAGDLATIEVAGPARMVAGTSATFSVAGRDAYGNPVLLDRASFDFAAPTRAGSALACYTEDGATGCAGVDVVPDALATIRVSGPSEAVAGTAHTFGLGGFDQHGNAVPLAQASLAWTAPTQAGSALVCHAEQGIEGCARVAVRPDALASILVTGPATLPAGETASFGLSGTDQYGNAVALAQASLSWTAPTAPGPQRVCHAEQGVQGCADVQVTEAPLAFIEVSGPAQMVAGTSAVFALAGSDAFGNPVALAQPSLSFLAPTQAGPAQACYAEQGVTGCAPVHVLAAALAAIDVSGPAEMVVGSSAPFALAGRDAYGNAVALAQGSLVHQAPTAAGLGQVCHGEQGITGCADVAYVPDALASIVVSGPASMVVGSSAAFGLAGFDQHGNAVALGLAELLHQAPTQAGPGQVCHGEQGIVGCASLVYVADALADIAVTGPAQMVAGSTATFGLAGSDRHGNPVALAQGTLAYTAPTQAGAVQVCHAEQGVQGCAPVEVVPDALATIRLAGPDEMAAGSSATFLLDGRDAHGNAVALARRSLDFTAPTLAPQQANVCHSEQGATGCRLVSVVAGPLAAIVLTGPDALVAGTAADFGLAGFDAFGNAVALARGTLAYVAPTQAGAARACHAEQGVEGCKDLVVRPDALAAIAIEGPLEVPAGSLSTYALAGADRYGNPVGLAQGSLDFAAPTLAGPAQVCYAEQGVSRCLDVLVTHAALRAIDVSGPAQLRAGEAATFALAGSDAYGNDVPLAAGSLAWTAPAVAGPARACYEEQGVEGCADVLVVPGPLARIAVSPWAAQTNVNQGKDIRYAARGLDAHGNEVPGLAFAWSATLGRIDAATGVYRAITAGDGLVRATADGVTGSAPVRVLNVLATTIVLNEAQHHMGLPVRGHALVKFADGDAVRNAKVVLTFKGTSWGAGQLCSGQVSGFTNAAGLFAFQAPGECTRLGDYRIEAVSTWSANRGTGSATYEVGL